MCFWSYKVVLRSQFNVAHVMLQDGEGLQDLRIIMKQFCEFFHPNLKLDLLKKTSLISNRISLKDKYVK